MKKFATLAIALALAWSCSNDDNGAKPVPDINSAPKMAAQAFTANENIGDAVVIGTVTATDEDGDKLSFSIATNDSDLFEVTTAGELSLATGSSLDFGKAESHKITIAVSDGEDTASAEITINVTNVNVAPVFGEEAYGFEAAEGIDDATLIGTVTATDGDGDTLTFGLSANDSGLFEISAEGELTLATGKSLDFEAATEHSITVQVTDGTADPVSVEVTIVVTNVIETLFEDPASFITTWNIPQNNFELTIGTNPNLDLNYEFTIDWGDGTVEDLAVQDPTHVYQTAGTYTVAIQGDFPTIQMSSANVNVDDASRLAMASIDQWGTIKWKSMGEAFAFCENMVNKAADIPDLSQVTNMYGMFGYATSFNGDLSGWDVSNVSNMGAMFAGTSFNGDLSGWDVSNVISMEGMFGYATSFNGAIGGWDTGNVTNMSFMFVDADSFDQELGGWNISNVAKMEFMFDSSGMSALSFSNTLVGWASMEVLPNIDLGAEGINICENGDGFNAYLTLTGAPNNWTISFGASEVCN